MGHKVRLTPSPCWPRQLLPGPAWQCAGLFDPPLKLSRLKLFKAFDFHIAGFIAQLRWLTELASVKEHEIDRNVISHQFNTPAIVWRPVIGLAPLRSEERRVGKECNTQG